MLNEIAVAFSIVYDKHKIRFLLLTKKKFRNNGIQFLVRLGKVGEQIG